MSVYIAVRVWNSRLVFCIGLRGRITTTKKGTSRKKEGLCLCDIPCDEILYISYSHTYLGQAAKKSIFIDEILGTVSGRRGLLNISICFSTRERST
jgi:hypothetical protein